MADAAVTFLLDNVTKLLTSYVDLISGAEDELRLLENELKLLKAFLDRAADIESKDQPLREIERQIREAVYDAEDTIDSCMIQDAAQQKPKSKHFFSRRLNPKSLNPKSLSLAKEVRSLRETKIKQMLELAKTEIGDGSSKGEQQQGPRVIKAPTIRQENIVGLQDQEDILMKYLMDNKEEVDVISIIGMPGLGKTTLAWKIYQNQDIQYEFPTRIWVYVSQEFNRRDVFLNILKKFTSIDMSSLSDQDLDLQVHDFLKRGKFLLVLDDVWAIEAWKAIRDVLPKSSDGSRVLITSRHANVGKYANREKTHSLRFLEDHESWELLQYEVFRKLDACPYELEDIGKYIAKQCHGLPLAIVVIGGILVDQLPTQGNHGVAVDAWKNVSDNVTTHVRNNQDHNISEIVAWSYNKLPNHLRDCFVYLAVFPEDYEIPAWTLTRLWIAEGFVRQKEGQSLEETAEENLKDLINRNLVMVDRTSPNGQVKTCRVHDVIRAFCISKATEQNLFREIKMSRHGTFDPLPSNVKNYRRLCIHSYLSDFLNEDVDGRGVRSFLCFNKIPNYRLEGNYLSAIPDAFKLLRILDTKSIKLTQFPLKVTKLIHLRYITLRYDNLDYLPEAISSLWNLQTLLVDTQSPCLRVKANIWKMIQLRHLKTKAAIALEKEEENQVAGENLQTLDRLSPKYCTEDVFRRAKNLKSLGIRGQLSPLADSRSLSKLVHLEKLKLVYDLVNKPSSENQLLGLPQPDYFPPNLQRLTLSDTYLNWKHMSILGKIESLRVLKLKDYAFTGKSWSTAAGDFGCLQYLLIESTDLVFWEASTDSFPRLGHLVLKNCARLSTIPWHLEKSLEILEIENVAPSAVESAKKIKERIDCDQGQQKDRRGGLLKLTIGRGC